MEDVFLLDVWGLGCVVYELVFRKACVDFKDYDQDRVQNVMENIKSKKEILISALCANMVTWKKERKCVSTLLDIYENVCAVNLL
jgi:hypothetical protein